MSIIDRSRATPSFTRISSSSLGVLQRPQATSRLLPEGRAPQGHPEVVLPTLRLTVGSGGNLPFAPQIWLRPRHSMPFCRLLSMHNRQLWPVLSLRAGRGGERASLAIAPALAQPRLEVLRPSETTLQFRWPGTAVGFVLEAANALATTTDWQPLDLAPVLSDGRYSVTLPAEAATRFFRLRSTVVPLTTIAWSSPANWEGGVAVTRATILRSADRCPTRTR